ncbi:hypothetical protein LCGC14_0275280 [marine sediment metagenome]|uniref:Glycosyltransferase 2-like domain-containing protein n=1 Tax=marine sediment metagenome TaxID=412755 RepID=A0A0F9X2M9_9ZZZZ
MKEIKLHLIPPPKPEEKLRSGVDIVIRRMHNMLPDYGISFVGSEKNADLFAGHIHSHNMRTRKIDVLHCHGLYPTAEPAEMENWMWRINQLVIDSAREASVVTVPSPWVAELFARDMGFWPEVVPHGLGFDEWPEKPYSFDSPVVLWNKNRTFGVCSPESLDELAQAALGTQFITTFGERATNVSVIGSMTYQEMKKVVYSSNIYFAPTKETFGIGILEAMAAGLPVLGWRWGHLPFLVRHKKEGYVAEPGNMEDTLRGLQYIQDNHQELSRAARKRALEYTWAKSMGRYRSVYDLALRNIARDREGHISVIIPCYNYSSFVVEAIESVKAQTYDNWECIVVNDGSKDDSLQVIRAAVRGDSRFTVIDQPNQGVAAARNSGAMASSGEFLSFLDADDRMLPNFLVDLLTGITQKATLGLVYGKLATINEAGEVSRRKSDWPPKFRMDQQLKNRCQVPSCNMMRRRAFMRAGGFRQHAAPAEDAELWTRIPLIGYDVERCTEEAVYQYRVHKMSSTAQIRRAEKEEPRWLAWLPVANGGPIPFAARIAPDNKVSHPVPNYDRPEVSFVIPVWDGHKTLLQDALESIAGQIDDRWEVIVVDDTKEGDLEDYGSVPYRDAYPWVRWVRNQKIGNVSAARNIGVMHTRGRYLTFVDADDYLMRGYVHETLLAAEECPDDAMFFYSDWYALPEGKAHRAEPWNLDRLKLHALFAITFLHPRKAFFDIGGFDENLALWEDWDYEIKLGMNGYGGARVPLPLFAYRYDTGVRREESLRNKDALLLEIRGRYSDMTPAARRG